MRKNCLLALVACLLFPSLVKAESQLLQDMPHLNAGHWYPVECCSKRDCAVVEKVEILTFSSANMLGAPGSSQSMPGGIRVTTKHGTVDVPANEPRRESPPDEDGIVRMHACMRPADSPLGSQRRGIDGKPLMKLICIFFPPSM